MLKIPRNLHFLRKYSKRINSLIDISPEIENALKTNGPVVALESTVITHGMPYPRNLQTALELESIVREKNAIPATIAIINGRIKVGLSDNEFDILGKGSTSENVIKTSRRDLAYVVSKGLSGGTTVSGTIIVANAVGIDVFATGGIGGVHRDAETTMDVSADLTELGRSSIAVVSSGVKSILDIEKTLEYLETQGVAVATYQTTDKEFPAFYTRRSGIKAPYNLNDPIEAANLILTAKELNLNSGCLIAVPVPTEFAMNEVEISAAIKKAIEKAKAEQISGKKITPFLLSAIGQITKNSSLQTNVALLKNNARVGAEIAVQLSKIKQNGRNGDKPKSASNQTSSHNSPVVIGGSIVDICCQVADHPIEFNGGTYQSTFKSSGGGVGRNIAEGLSKLNGHVAFVSKIGNDENGDFLLKLLPPHCQTAIERDAIHQTATCTVIFDGNGNAKLYLANMDIHNSIDSDMIKKHENLIKSAPLVVFDGNISEDLMGTILDMCRKYKKPAFFEPTDMRIASKPFSLPNDLVRQIKFISPNIFELKTIANHFGHEHLIDINELDIEQQIENDSKVLTQIVRTSTEIAKYIDNVVVTLGSQGVLITRNGSGDDLRFFAENRYIESTSGQFNPVNRLYHTQKITNVANVSGAGDSFNAGFITAMIKNLREEICVSVGSESAKIALNSTSAVPNRYFDANHECWQKSAVYRNI